MKAVEYMNDGYNWVVDIDLEKFFDTVNHNKLISILNKEIKDGKVLSLIRKFLVSGVMVGKHMEETEIGTPQNKYRNLVKLGIEPRNAARAAWSHGYARICRSEAVCYGMLNVRLARFGLLSAEAYFVKVSS